MATKKRSWSQSQLDEALVEIGLGKSTNSVSQRFNIPRSTLITKKSGQVELNATFGPSPILSPNEERDIVKWMLYCSNRGVPVTKTQLIMSVAQLIKILKKETPFKNGIPGRRWYEAFLRRHPEITSRVAQNLTSSRSQVSEEKLRNWFEEVKMHLTKNDLLDLDASRIFNCDESAFFMCPKGERVLVRKGEKAVYNFVMNDEKECLTTLFMVNAAGLMTPPMVVFSYERLPYSICQSFPEGWSIGKTDNGWMTGESFFEYLANVFDPWLTKNKIERPVILYVDGHASHLTMPTVEFCIKHDIQLIALYPNATHLIQPLDVALFSPLKKIWRKDIHEWRIAHQRKIRREDFAGLLKSSVEKLDLEEIMQNGFRTCGLYPFNPDAIKYNNLLNKGKESMITTPIEGKKKKLNDAQNALQIFENHMDEDLLKLFKSSEGTWNGDVEQIGLFSMWKNLVVKSNLASNIENHDASKSKDKMATIAKENSPPNNSVVSLQSDENHLAPLAEENVIHSCDSLFKTDDSTNAFDRTFNELLSQEDSIDSIEEISDMIDNSSDVIETHNESSRSSMLQICESLDNNTIQDADELLISLDDMKKEIAGTSMINNDGGEIPVIIIDDTTGIEDASKPLCISPAFKEAFFWPTDNNKTHVQRKKKDKVPSVATSDDWINYYKAKEQEKLDKKTEIEENKRKRKLAAEEKKKTQEDKKKKIQEEKIKKQEEKKKIDEEKKKMKEEKKKKNQKPKAKAYARRTKIVEIQKS